MHLQCSEYTPAMSNLMLAVAVWLTAYRLLLLPNLGSYNNATTPNRIL